MTSLPFFNTKPLSFSGQSASAAAKTALMPHVRAVNEQTFSTEVLQSKQPVLALFWAPWCGPCKRLAPVIDSIARQVNNTETHPLQNIQFVQINTDNNPTLKQRFRIQYVPTLLFFQPGQSPRVINARTESSITQALQNHR